MKQQPARNPAPTSVRRPVKIFNLPKPPKPYPKKWNKHVKKQSLKQQRNSPLRIAYSQQDERNPKKLNIKPPVYPPDQYKKLSNELKSYHSKFSKIPFAYVRTPYNIGDIKRPIEGKLPRPPVLTSNQIIARPPLPPKQPVAVATGENIIRPPSPPQQQIAAVASTQSVVRAPLPPVHNFAVKTPPTRPPPPLIVLPNAADKPYDVTRDVLYYLPAPDLSNQKPPKDFKFPDIDDDFEIDNSELQALDSLLDIEINSVSNDIVNEILKDEDVSDIFTKKRDINSIQNYPNYVEDDGIIIDLVGSNSFVNVPRYIVSEEIDTLDDRVDDNDIIEYVEPLDTLQMALLEVEDDMKRRVSDPEETNIEVVIDYLEKVSIFYH